MIYRKIFRLRICKNISNKFRKSRILQSISWGYISLDYESNECRGIISRNDKTESRGSRYLLSKLDPGDRVKFLRISGIRDSSGRGFHPGVLDFLILGLLYTRFGIFCNFGIYPRDRNSPRWFFVTGLRFFSLDGISRVELPDEKPTLL